MFRKPNGRKPFIRLLLWMTAAVMLITGAAFAAGAVPENGEKLFARFEGMEWTFSSGAGGWSTDLRIQPDGTFTGVFHDSEMGETADEYPNGTVYYCEFSGKFSVKAQEDDHTWRLRVDELKQNDEPDKETIEDGIRFVATSSYGIEHGDELTLYQPGTPLEALTESMRFWSHTFGTEAQNTTALQKWFMYSEKLDAGFVGDLTDPTVSIASPWETLSADQMKALTALPLNLPEEAEQAGYRWYRIDEIAEMQFTWNNGDFCFRAQNTEPQKDSVQDISGLYFTWEHEEPVQINGNKGTIGLAQSGNGDMVERCIWYDEARQTAYSLSVTAPEVDGLDLTAVAETIVTASR